MQTMLTVVGEHTHALDMPMADEWLMPGIRWGRFEELFTGAYWCGQAWQAGLQNHFSTLRLGRSLSEETAACLLGGYGMKAEVGLAAFHRLRGHSLLEGVPSAASIESLLERPFEIDGKSVRYRFPRQKAAYLAGCLRMLDGMPEEALTDLELRQALMGMPGIGPKTASWIVRNHRHSNEVAVLDVHILRAGQLLGLFGRNETPQSHYLSLERRFLEFARAVKAPASLLDALIWYYMRLLRPA